MSIRVRQKYAETVKVKDKSEDRPNIKHMHNFMDKARIFKLKDETENKVKFKNKSGIRVLWIRLKIKVSLRIRLRLKMHLLIVLILKMSFRICLRISLRIGLILRHN